MRKATKKRLTAAPRLGRVSRPKLLPPGVGDIRLNVKLVPCHVCGHERTLIQGLKRPVIVNGKPLLDDKGERITEFAFDATEAVCRKPSCRKKHTLAAQALMEAQAKQMLEAMEAEEVTDAEEVEVSEADTPDAAPDALPEAS